MAQDAISLLKQDHVNVRELLGRLTQSARQLADMGQQMAELKQRFTP